jgi:hypothetical protein
MRTSLRILFTWLLLAGTVAQAQTPSPVRLAPAEHVRGPDQAFLTFPEWYLVHSPAEYAAYLQGGRAPSQFPLFAHVAQFWQGYAAVTRETSAYPFNGGYHLMVGVIGTSTTVEYGLKGLYERTVGRLAEATRSGDGQTPEEAFAAKAAQEYVDFIRVEPWYLFDFWSRLEVLWKDVPLGGPDALRRWERRFLLTSEYLAKEGYARLIKLGTQSIYDAPKPVTHVVLDKSPAPAATFADYAELGRHDGSVLATIPRYEGFTTYGRWLAGQGLQFQEIAGNRGEIVVSVLAPARWQAGVPSTRLLFSQPMLTQPQHQRFVLAVNVAQLADLMRLESPTVKVEHVYDF